MIPSYSPPSQLAWMMLVWQQMTQTLQLAPTIPATDRRKIMRYEMTSEWQYEINQERAVQDLGEEAASFGEFARALLISLGAVLFVSAGTYLVFTGFVASLLALIA